MKQPTLTITKRKVRSRNLYEAHMNKSAIELIKAARIKFEYEHGYLKLVKPERGEKAYKITRHTQLYKKKTYKSSAKFSPAIVDSEWVVGKFLITQGEDGRSFNLSRIE